MQNSIVQVNLELTQRKLQNSPGSVYKNSLIILDVRLSVKICLRYATYNNFNKAIQVLLFREILKSEIKTMKFMKCLTAWYQIRKTLQLLLKISS